MNVLLRWDSPVYTNGLLEGYSVDCWFFDEETKDFCDNITVPARDEEIIVENLYYNVTFYFQVSPFYFLIGAT